MLANIRETPIFAHLIAASLCGHLFFRPLLLHIKGPFRVRFAYSTYWA